MILGLFRQPFKWLHFCFIFCRRLAMPLLQRLSRKIYPFYGSPRIFRLGKGTVLKSGSWVRVTEATTMRYIAEHTTIPVPKVLDAWPLKNGGASILMEWLNDVDTLENRWTSMSAEQKMKVCVQISGYVDQLRALPQPPERHGSIGPLDGAPCWDERLRCQFCGPFESEQAFNQYRLSLVEQFRWEKSAREIIDGISRDLRDDHRIVFTHGDLGVRNILVDARGDVAALIDWEMSGWMPEYWEYFKCVHGRWEDEEWLSLARVMTPPYDAEMEVDDRFILVHGAPF